MEAISEARPSRAQRTINRMQLLTAQEFAEIAGEEALKAADAASEGDARRTLGRLRMASRALTEALRIFAANAEGTAA